MTWWLKAAEELRTLRHLRIAGSGSVVSGFILDAPTVTIEGEATELPQAAAAQPLAPAQVSSSPDAAPSCPEAPAPGSAPAEPVNSSFLRGARRYKLRYEIRPQQRKTANR
jgi:hypothetical protein